MLNRGGARHARVASPWSRRRLWLLGLAGVAVVAAAAIVAFHVTPSPTPVPPASPALPLSAKENPPTTPTATAMPNPAGLAGEFAQFQAGLHAKVGVVVRAVGSGPVSSIALGGADFADQPAWSTIKVPLVIASMRKHNDKQPTAAMVAAITESDNAAAESIWEGLGDPSTAAADVGSVLRDSGDPTTVESRKLRPEFTAFGQTGWSLTNEAKFLSFAACDPRDQAALNLMGQVTSDQRSWGVGAWSGAKVKGGWGPSPTGRYLVRQIGVVPAGPRGLVVVAMAALPDSGSFGDGTRALTQIGDWLHTRLDALPAARCAH